MRFVMMLAGMVVVLAAVGFTAFSLMSGPVPVQGAENGTVAFISLPSGFRADIFAADVPGVRSLALGDEGTVFAGTRDRGRVYGLKDTDGDGKSDLQWVIAEGLFMPNGVAFSNGSLYVAEVNRIVRFDDPENNSGKSPEPVTIFSNLPSDTGHGWKFIRFGPDGKLYIPIGVPCNICESDDERFGTIIRIDPDGDGYEIYARGIRNTVGFDWDPETGVLWFTENGRDWLGDDLPPDELNRAPDYGMDFGFPYYYGNCVEDPEYAGKLHSSDCTPAALNLQAHVAPLGMRFYDGTMFPEEYSNTIFIAEHGSWNRKSPVGYQVITVKPDGGNSLQAVPFAAGFLTSDGKVLGRPVDIEIMPDGSLLISDDHADRIYRITYGGAL